MKQNVPTNDTFLKGIRMVTMYRKQSYIFKNQQINQLAGNNEEIRMYTGLVQQPAIGTDEGQNPVEGIHFKSFR